MNGQVPRLAVRILALLAFGVASASAVSFPLTYEVGTGSSVNANGGSGLEIEWALASDLSDQVFSLRDGESYTFEFFDIWTDETSVNSDDQATKAITATLNFAVPSISALINGGTVGVSFFGIIQLGAVIWDNPAPTFTAGDRVFSIDLSDEAFNLGIFGLNEGQHYGATVEATVTQISSSAPSPSVAVPVPDGGGTLLLCGFGMLVFEGWRRASLRRTSGM